MTDYNELAYAELLDEYPELNEYPDEQYSGTGEENRAMIAFCHDLESEPVAYLLPDL